MHYQIRMALFSMRKTPALSALMAVAVGLGIGVFLTILTVYTMMSGDPLPHKSDKVFTYMLDNREQDADPEAEDTANPMINYRDAINLMASDIPSAHSVHYPTTFLVTPDDQSINPFVSRVRLASQGFFSLFEFEFLYGGAWSETDERDLRQVVVLGKELNERLFRGEDSVGRKVLLDDRHYEVIGVVDEYQVVPTFFEYDHGPFRKQEGAYIPFSLTPVLEKYKGGGSTMCDGGNRDDGFQAFLDAECRFLHHWVQLDSPEKVEQFRLHLDAYAEEQRQYGRFLGPYNHQLHDIMSWLDYQSVVNDDYRVLLGIAVMFLSVCIINAIGLLIAKYQRRAGEFSIYRALGASKRRLILQNMVEIAVIGGAASVVGLLCSVLGLSLLRQLYRHYDRIAHLNLEMVFVGVAGALLATLVAGLIPAWRVAQQPPAAHLKLQ